MAGVIEAEFQKEQLRGIIYKLKNTYNIKNPITAEYVVPSASGTNQGYLETTVLWNHELFTAGNSNGNPWVQLEFPMLRTKNLLFTLIFVCLALFSSVQSLFIIKYLWLYNIFF